MSTKKFKAESKRLLELMINSIYTNKEIFLRELISNSSDAIDKSYYLSLSDASINFNKEDFYIRITPDRVARTLTISDTGIGMTKDELENNLGTIARSGSLAFKEENQLKDGYDIIGQFGVGFYSAFMVAKKIIVESKGMNSDEAYRWTSTGEETFTIEPCKKTSHGTTIVLFLKDNTEDVDYDQFLDTFQLSQLIKKYSDFIKYPIKMFTEHSRLKEGEEKEYETYMEDETLNSMIPIWKKSKSELKDEDYSNFYHDKHYGFDTPLTHIHYNVDGATSYTALLYIPEKTPFNFYTKDYQKGLSLYSSGVMIMDKCSELLPDYFGFIKGVVDSQDLSLNISREILQQDRQLKFISKKLTDKIKKELLSLQKNDREKYEKFWASFGRTIKFGVYDNWGMNKDELMDLLMFYSSTEDKLVTLGEYVDRMKEDQKEIFYQSGESIDKIKKMPQIEYLQKEGYEILYLTDEVDEFAIKVINTYKEKAFSAVANADLNKEADSKSDESDNSDLFSFIKESLGDKISEVKASKILVSHPVCLSYKGDLSIEMEKVLNSMPDGNNMKAEKVLELNTAHPVFQKLKTAFETDKDKATKISRVLYNQALLIEGLSIEDAVEFSNDLCSII
ncbi:MAG: molecular chaperone HtpG [Filifactoraceae bacterium]